MKSISVQSFEFQISFKEVLSLLMISFSSSSLSLALRQTKQRCDAKIASALGDAKEGIFRGEGSDLLFNKKSSRNGHSYTKNRTTLTTTLDDDLINNEENNGTKDKRNKRSVNAFLEKVVSNWLSYA